MHHPPLSKLCLALFLAQLLAASAVHAVEAEARKSVLASITTEEAKDHVAALADDTFEGREAGTRGNRAAAGYIVDRLKKFGLKGAGPKDSYFQNFGSYRNILAIAEGSDPELKKQTIVIGAHYDHVGYGSARNSYGPIGLIHNGADDNASGVAAMLEVAEAISRLPQKPRRSILFAFWDGEEKGLLGSKHWVEQPTVPLVQVPIMINADMVGRLRNGRVELFGSRTAPGLRQVLSRQNDISQLIVDFRWEMKGDSDHYSFYSRNIPVLMPHTGMHGDYHRPSDDADKVNAEGIKQVAQWLFGTLVELADAPTLPSFRAKSRTESQYDRQTAERALAPLPGRFGIRWDEKAATDGAIVVTSVSPGSAAEVAGIKIGDRILKLGGREISSAPGFRLSVLAATSPAVAVVERKGEERPLELNVALPGSPVRLGISWRKDEAETNCVIVNRVTPGSPADVAGLRVNDRIYSAAGEPYTDDDAFRKLATNPEALTLEVETAGQIRIVEIPPVPAPEAASAETQPEQTSGAKS